MGDDKKEPWLIWEDEGQLNSESSGKASHEAKRHEDGVGNRKPEGPPTAKNAFEVSSGPFYKLKTTLEGDLKDSREAPGADQKTFYQLVQGKVGDVEVASASVNLTEGKAKATLVKGKAEGSIAHGEIDIVAQIVKFFFGSKKPEQKAEPPRTMPAPQAARVSDFVSHVGILFPGIGSPNVFIGGLPAWRAGIDTHLCTAPGPPHGAGMVVVPTQTTVLINGFPAARAGDFLVEATGGPNMIVTGCPTVLIGSPAPPPPPDPGNVTATAEPPSVTLEAVAKGDFLAGEASVDAYAEVDLTKGKAVAELQGGAMVALLKGELPLKVKIPIPGTEYSIGLGLTLEGTLLSAGAEAGGGVVVNDGKKAFGFTGGAKAGIGIGGVGAKFGFDISK